MIADPLRPGDRGPGDGLRADLPVRSGVVLRYSSAALISPSAYAATSRSDRGCAARAARLARTAPGDKGRVKPRVLPRERLVTYGRQKGESDPRPEGPERQPVIRAGYAVASATWPPSAAWLPGGRARISRTRVEEEDLVVHGQPERDGEHDCDGPRGHEPG